MSVRRIGTTLLATAALLSFSLESDAATRVKNHSISHPSAAGSWQALNSMSAATSNFSLVSIGGGKVLAVNSLAPQIFDSTTGQWSAAAPIGLLSAASPTAVTLADGRVLISGGVGAVKTARIYNPSLNTWTTTGSMKVGRYQHTATLLQDGRVLVTGGVASGDSTSAELYDPATGTWALTASMNNARVSGHVATLLADGTVLVTGGTGSTATPAEIFDPGSSTWGLTGVMVAARNGHNASLLQNGKVLVTGGCGGYSLSKAIDGYDVTVGASCRSTEIYDPALGTWQAAHSMKLPRASFSATVMTNGKVLVAGGAVGCASAAPTGIPLQIQQCLPTNSAELYDPATDTWSWGPNMASAVESQRAVLLGDGRVLLAGGSNGKSAVANAEAFTSN